MRYAILLVIGLLGAAGAYFGLEFRREIKERAAAAEAARQAAASGIEEAFRLGENLALQFLVLAPEMVPGEREFRARVEIGNERRSVYGRAQATCDADLDRGRCWRIVSVEIDGVAVEVGSALVEGQSSPEIVGEAEEDWTIDPTGASPAAEASEAVSSASNARTATDPGAPLAPPHFGSNPLRIVDGDALSAAEEIENRVQAARIEAGLSSGPAEEASTPARAGTATHRVSTSFVNARSAPQVAEGNVVVTLRAETRLRLTEQQGGWGRFAVVETPEGEGPLDEEVWIAMRLTSEL